MYTVDELFAVPLDQLHLFGMPDPAPDAVSAQGAGPLWNCGFDDHSVWLDSASANPPALGRTYSADTLASGPVYFPTLGGAGLGDVGNGFYQFLDPGIANSFLFDTVNEPVDPVSENLVFDPLDPLVNATAQFVDDSEATPENPWSEFTSLDGDTPLDAFTLDDLSPVLAVQPVLGGAPADTFASYDTDELQDPVYDELSALPPANFVYNEDPFQDDFASWEDLRRIRLPTLPSAPTLTSGAPNHGPMGGFSQSRPFAGPSSVPLHYAAPRLDGVYVSKGLPYARGPKGLPTSAPALTHGAPNHGVMNGFDHSHPSAGPASAPLHSAAPSLSGVCVSKGRPYTHATATASPGVSLGPVAESQWFDEDVYSEHQQRHQHETTLDAQTPDGTLAPKAESQWFEEDAYLPHHHETKFDARTPDATLEPKAESQLFDEDPYFEHQQLHQRETPFDALTPDVTLGPAESQLFDLDAYRKHQQLHQRGTTFDERIPIVLSGPVASSSSSAQPRASGSKRRNDDTAADAALMPIRPPKKKKVKKDKANKENKNPTAGPADTTDAGPTAGLMRPLANPEPTREGATSAPSTNAEPSQLPDLPPVTPFRFGILCPHPSNEDSRVPCNKMILGGVTALRAHLMEAKDMGGHGGLPRLEADGRISCPLFKDPYSDEICGACISPNHDGFSRHLQAAGAEGHYIQARELDDTYKPIGAVIRHPVYGCPLCNLTFAQHYGGRKDSVARHMWGNTHNVSAHDWATHFIHRLPAVQFSN